MRLALITVTAFAVLVSIAGWIMVARLRAPKVGIYLLYLDVWFIAIFLVGAGAVVALAAWAIPEVVKLNHSDTKPILEITAAAVSAVLAFVGKQLLDLRHVEIAKKMLKWTLKTSFKRCVPNTLKENPNESSADRLAYMALNNDAFVAPGKPAIRNWGPKDCCMRIELIQEYLDTLRPETPSPSA